MKIARLSFLRQHEWESRYGRNGAADRLVQFLYFEHGFSPQRKVWRESQLTERVMCFKQGETDAEDEELAKRYTDTPPTYQTPSDKTRWRWNVTYQCLVCGKNEQLVNPHGISVCSQKCYERLCEIHPNYVWNRKDIHYD